jgi:hypothetical protein
MVRSASFFLPFPHLFLFRPRTFHSHQRTGSPRTLLHFLYEHIPHLLPSPSGVYLGPDQGGADSLERTAYVLIHGKVIPFDTHLAWLGDALLGADGWVDVVVGF